jgi:hypothetical protein
MIYKVVGRLLGEFIKGFFFGVGLTLGVVILVNLLNLVQP